ncbi:MAG TPA: HIT family protein [Synergistales bacterium]|nr:HIT family protein [Synergistales bacterium]
MKGCIFCSISQEKVIENELAYAIWDSFPVNPGHMLIIPRRHISSYFETTPEEREALDSVMFSAKKLVDRKYQPDGYNIGINHGEAAGQSIMHLHIHLIPRYYGDMDKPKGGVRGVIPHKRGYGKNK